MIDKVFDYSGNPVGFQGLGDDKKVMEIAQDLDVKLDKTREWIKSYKKDDNFVSQLLGIMGQDAIYSVPIFNKLRDLGVPKYAAFFWSGAIGGAIGLEKEIFGQESTFLLHFYSKEIQGLKNLVGILPNTPNDEIADEVVQALEYGAFSVFIPPIIQSLKFMKKYVPYFAGGAAVSTIPGDAKANPFKAIFSSPALEKMLVTKSGEVLPSLKKFGSKLFEKKTTSRFLKQAEEAEVGKNWYKQSGDNILKYVGGDKKAADQFAQILAIYSPQKEIPHNTLFAIKAWNRFKSGQKIWEGEILEKAKLPKNLNTTQENKFKKDLLAKYGGAKRVKGEKSTGLELVDLEDGNLMVVRHGTYENIAERTKAHLLLNENIPWGGRKTNSFYGNIMKKIDPSIKQAATIDLWMNRAGGFVNKELKDGPKYNFIESVVDTVAKKKKWDIDQAQAAIWVSTKARFNATKSLFSEKALKSGVGVRKGGHVVPAKGKNKEFADLRFNTAMNYKIASQDIEKAAINFADALDDNLAFVSWETVPGKYTKHLDGLEKASSQIKSEYHFKVSNLLTDDVGQDVLAKKLGILSPGHFEAPGYFKGISNPSGQTKIATTRIKGAGKDITTMDAPSQELLEKYAALRGVILSQNEIGYHRIIRAGSRKNANAAAVQVNNELTAEQFRKFGLALDKTFGVGNHAFISKEKGVLVLNTSKLNNTEFQKRLEKLVEIAIESKAQIIYYKNGNLISREATDYGKNYSDILGQIRRTDIRQLVRDLLTKKKNLDKEFSEKYGFRYDEKAFEEIESFIQRR